MYNFVSNLFVCLFFLKKKIYFSHVLFTKSLYVCLERKKQKKKKKRPYTPARPKQS